MVASHKTATRWFCTGLLLLWLFVSNAQASGQTPTEYQVKAAYLYNFAKFVEWPTSGTAQATSPLALCVLDDKQFEATLREVVSGKSIGSHPVTVIPVGEAGQARDCRVLFISFSHRRETSRVLEELGNASVLTVGEMDGFVQAGGMINFVLDDNHVHFQVNEKAATRAGLRVSSRLLNIAKLVVR